MTKWNALSNPKISIIICNFNYEKYIEAAINSVLNQTYPSHEIIIIDDGSTDNSVDIIREKFPDLKLIVKENAGQISAYNEGFKHLTGDVVLFLDSDDELMPDALRRVSAAYKTDIVKVQFKMRVIDKDGVDLNSVLPSTLDNGDCGEQLIKRGSLYKSPPASGNSYRVDALKALFPLPTSPEEKHGADYFCIYGISMMGDIASINEALFRYRVHDTGNNVASGLGFGNAIKKQDRQKVMLRRWRMLTEWINMRLDSDIQFESNYLDFTQQKFFYAQDMLNANSISQKLNVIKKHFVWIVKSIFARNDFNFLKKMGLIVWVFLLAITPQTICLKLSRMVCNPVRS